MSIATSISLSISSSGDSLVATVVDAGGSQIADSSGSKVLFLIWSASFPPQTFQPTITGTGKATLPFSQIPSLGKCKVWAAYQPNTTTYSGSSTSVITPIIGPGVSSINGISTTALLNPMGIATDRAGNLWIADQGKQTVFMAEWGALSNTFTNLQSVPFPPTAVTEIYAIATDPSVPVEYVSNCHTAPYYRISGSAVTPVVLATPWEPISAAHFFLSLAVDRQSRVCILGVSAGINAICRMDPGSGTPTQISQSFSSDEAQHLGQIAFDANGNLYIASPFARAVYKVTFNAAGAWEPPLAAQPIPPPVYVPQGLAVDSSGTYCGGNSAAGAGELRLLDWTTQTFFSLAPMNNVNSLAISPLGDLLIADQNGSIQQLTFFSPNVTASTQTTVSPVTPPQDGEPMPFNVRVTCSRLGSGGTPVPVDEGLVSFTIDSNPVPVAVMLTGTSGIGQVNLSAYLSFGEHSISASYSDIGGKFLSSEDTIMFQVSRPPQPFQGMVATKIFDPEGEGQETIPLGLNGVFVEASTPPAFANSILEVQLASNAIVSDLLSIRPNALISIVPTTSTTGAVLYTASSTTTAVSIATYTNSGHDLVVAFNNVVDEMSIRATLQSLFLTTVDNVPQRRGKLQIRYTIAVNGDTYHDPSIDQRPVVKVNDSTALTYKVNASPIAIMSLALISDSDSANLSSLTVQVTSGYQNSHDILSFADQLGITGSFNATTGILTLAGSSSVGNYQQALRAVTFNTTGSSVSTATRTFAVNATDHAGFRSVMVTRSLTMTT